MKVLITCEESQRICTAFREMGHEAYSCDIQEPSGGHPEWHIHDGVLPYINGNCEFITMDGTAHKINGKWDLLITHPPYTYDTIIGTFHSVTDLLFYAKNKLNKLAGSSNNDLQED